MKILLFGKNGQLGRELQRSLGPLGHVVALHAHSDDFCGDFNNLSGIVETVLAVRPTVIVNAAAWTNVDQAETEPDLVRRVNSLAPGALAQAAACIGAWFVHYSSDYVFDGTGHRPWTEDDISRPLNVYGKSKRDGDELVAAHCPNHLILRTSWMYSTHGKNFVKAILDQARTTDRLAVVADQEGAPTAAAWVADMTALAIGQAIKTPELGGLYHLAAGGWTSWHAYAVFMLDCALRAGFDIKATPQSVKAVSSDDYPAAALRPKNSRLATGKFQNAFGVVVPQWQRGVKNMLMELKE